MCGGVELTTLIAIERARSILFHLEGWVSAIIVYLLFYWSLVRVFKTIRSGKRIPKVLQVLRCRLLAQYCSMIARYFRINTFLNFFDDDTKAIVIADFTLQEAWGGTLSRNSLQLVTFDLQDGLLLIFCKMVSDTTHKKIKFTILPIVREDNFEDLWAMRYLVSELLSLLRSELGCLPQNSQHVVNTGPLFAILLWTGYWCGGRVGWLGLGVEEAHIFVVFVVWQLGCWVAIVAHINRPFIFKN